MTNSVLGMRRFQQYTRLRDFYDHSHWADTVGEQYLLLHAHRVPWDNTTITIRGAGSVSEALAQDAPNNLCRVLFTLENTVLL